MPKKNQKYSDELEKIKLLKSINSMLKTSDIENVLLSNSSKDSEIVSESTIDNLLSKATSNKDTYKDINVFEKESMQSGTYKHVGKATAKSRAKHPKNGNVRSAQKKRPQKARKPIKRKK